MLLDAPAIYVDRIQTRVGIVIDMESANILIV